MAQRKYPDWAITDIADIGNGDPNKSDPGATKQANGWEVEKPDLQYMNWLQNLFGHFIRANNEVKVGVATGYEAEAGEIVLMDNSSGSATLDLPASPIDGQWVMVGGVELFTVNPVIVDGNGNDIMVASDSTCNLDINDRLFRFHWDDTASLWKISIADVLGRV